MTTITINNYNQNPNYILNNTFKVEIYPKIATIIQKNLSKISNWFQKDQNEIFFIAPRNNSIKYIIGKIIGNGSYGKVFNILNFPMFVLKIHVPEDVDFYHIAKKEATILSELSENPHVVKLIDHFDTNQPCQYAIILEKIFAPDLYFSVYRSNIKYSTSEIITITSQLLEATKELHKKRIIHSDLKLNNLIYLKETKQLTLIDFGLSEKLDSLSYFLIQTKQYRAPEIFLHAPFTETVDIWSIGCILFELYTGFVLVPTFTNNENYEDWNFQLHFFEKNLGPIPKQLLDVGKKTLDFYNCDQNGNYSLKNPMIFDRENLELMFQEAYFERQDHPNDLANIISLFNSMTQYIYRPSAEFLLENHPLFNTIEQ